MELIKESNFNENDSFSPAALPLHQLFSANSPNVPQNLNELSKSLLTLINSTSAPSAPLVGGTASHHQSSKSDMTKSSASTSNDESVDSQTCDGDEGTTKRTRCRRRKPQKTIRMANEMAPVANGNNVKSDSQSHKLADKPLEDTSQTQSMDLSNYSAGHDTFSNGKLTNSIYSATATKPMNGFGSMNMTRYSDPLHSMASATHLKGAFNTDDLVKKVEEIVKCNSNDEMMPTNFSATRNDDENKDFMGHLSNGGEKNCSISQSTIDEYAPLETRKLNGNENGIDLMTSHESDARKGKPNVDEVPLLPNAEVKLPEISLPVANSTPKRDHIDEVENHLEKMFAHVENSEASTTAVTATSTNGVAEDTTQNDSENQNSQTNNDTNNDSELAAKSNEEQGASTAAPTPSTSQSKPSRSRKRPAANGRKRGASSARRPNKSNSKAGTNGKNTSKNSGGSKSNGSSKNAKSNRNGDKADTKKTKEELAAAESVAKFRGPFIQIQPDGSECIVNAPITEEVIEKLNKNRKLVVPGASSARSRVIGLHVSTLSNKYDAITTDTSWMCVFCKLGPHKYGLGDLFGPFILSVESEQFQESQFDPSEDVFRSHRTNADMVQVKGGMKVVPAKASTSSAATANNAGNVRAVSLSLTSPRYVFNDNFLFHLSLPVIVSKEAETHGTLDINRSIDSRSGYFLWHDKGERNCVRSLGARGLCGLV